MRTIIIATALLLSVPVAGRQADTIYRPGNGVSLPVVQREVRPEYTAEARDARVEGSVTMDAVVQTDGTVGDVTVTNSLDTTYGLDRQAVAAMKQWVFTPGKKDGKSVAVRISIVMTFALRP